MTDIVSIGFQVRTDQIEAGFKRMDKLGKTSEQTEKRVTKSVNEMSSSFSLLKDNIGLVQTTLAALVASSGIGAAISANREFAKSVSGLSAITGAVGDDLEFYKQQAAEIGSTTTLSASQAVTAFKLIASAKPDLLASKEALAQVTREAVALSEATGGELGLTQAASALGGALNQFQLDASESSRVVNLLAEASRAGAADVVSISDSLVNVGAAANAMGVNIVEVVAGLEALAAGEIKGSEAGTGLRQVLVGLEKTGKQNLMPSVVGLTKAIENLAAMNLSTTDTIKLFGQEGLAAASTITAQIGTLTSLASTIDGTSTAYNQASTQVNNLDGDLKSLNSVIESIAIGIGEDLDPALRSAAQSMTEILSNTESLGDAIEAAAVVVAIGATPAVVTYTKSLYAQIAAQLIANTQAVKTVNVLGQVRYAAASATVATNALGMATRFLLGPWGLLLSALGAATIAYNLSSDASEKQNKSLESQLELTKKTEKQVKLLSETQRADVALQSQLEINDLKKQQLSLEQQLLTSSFDSNQPASLTLATNEKLAKVKARILELEGLIKAAQSSETPKKVTKETNEAYEKQIIALNSLAEQLGLTSDELIVYNEVQKSIARGDTKEQTAEIERQARAYIKLKNEAEAFNNLLTGQDNVYDKNPYQQWIDGISTVTTKTQDLQEEIKKVKFAMAEGDISETVGNEYIADLEKQIKSLEVNPFQSMTEGAQDALQAMSGMFESGSKDAKKLAIAMQALNLVQAVGAVLNQGSGDPYTAFGRMAAMAAMVASLGISIGNLSGGFADESAARQESQNLNSWGEHATSIADATEQTANATKKLVGINTDMLEALQNLTIALASASTIIAKNITIPTTTGKTIGNVLDLGNYSSALGNLTDFATNLLDPTGILGGVIGKIGSWLGGKSKVTDEGIRILGGSLSDLMEDVTIQAFQSIKYKKWRFGSTKRKTSFANLGDEVSAQFALVFESIADSVATGAEILGFSADDISEALDAFVIKTTSLSLKDLSASKQAEVIQNYFSSVFNSVAVAVVPFLRDFQQVGEELGTTLSRLATEVSVAEYLVDNFGVTFADKFADQEAFITAADNLATLAGGVEELAGQVSSFTDAFATDTQKFQIYQEAMKSALEEVGLSLPSSTAGFYELMSSLDATTEAGQQQIATLLGLTDTASAYYDLLDDTAGKFRDAAEALYDISYAAAQVSLDSALAAARLGDFSLAEALDLNSIAPSTSDFSSALEFNLARAETAAKLNELATLQEGSTTIDEKQLTVLEEIRDSLNSRDTITSSDSTSSQLVEQMAALKSEFKTLSNQITYGVLTVRQETTA